jgi:hypothetical protein
MKKRISEGHIVNQWHGYEVFLGMTGVLQGSENNNKNAPNGDSLAATGSVDFVISKDFYEHGAFLLHLESGVGEGLNADPIFNSLMFGVVNYDALSHAARIEFAEGYYQGDYFDEKFEFLIGRIDPTVIFDENAVAKDETSEFLNGGFRNNTTIDFPDYTFGGKALVRPVEWAYLSAGIADANTDGYELKNMYFGLLSLAFLPKIKELEGNYRFYGWGNHRDHTNEKHGWTNDYGWGVGTSIDQQLTDWFTLFARGDIRKKQCMKTTWRLVVVLEFMEMHMVVIMI